MEDFKMNNNVIDISDTLKAFFLKQIINERELTQNKINILLTYSQKQLFNYLLQKDNKENQNYISSKSIINKFNSFKEKEINKIIQIYDKDNDSLLNYKEFYYFISPKYIDTNIDELRNKNSKKIDSENIDEKGIDLLKNIINIELKNLKELSFIINTIINNLNFNKDISPYLHLFKLIKGNNIKHGYTNDYLLINDVLLFINKNNKKEFKIYEQDIANLIFRFDYDNDLKLNFKEFSDMINYFLKDNNAQSNRDKKNFGKNRNNLNIGKLFYDYSSLNIDITNGSQFNTINKLEDPSFDLSKNIEEKNQNEQSKTINENRQNSFINNVSLTYNDLDDVLSYLINNKNNYNCNGNNIDINSVINLKAKDLQNMKINLLVEFLTALINELDTVEINKQKLAKEYNINIDYLFDLFDCNNEENISTDNLIYVFDKYFDKKFEEKDFFYLIKKYDKNKDNKLNYNEFCHMIKPTSVKSKKILENNINSKKTINEYNDDEKKCIFNLFLVLLNCEENIQNQKLKLKNCPLFTYFEMFEFIRNKKTKLIKKEDISYFFKSNNKLIKNNELENLLNYLFFPKENNESFCFRDFMRILQPM